MPKTKQQILNIIEQHQSIIRDPLSSNDKVVSSRIAIKALEDELGKFTDDSFGVRNYKKLDLKTLEIKASQGDAEAQCTLGDLLADYTKAEYCDINKAIYWYSKSAEQGHTRAQWLLGVGYSQGIGVEKDLEKAEYWLLKSAQAGNVDAQYVLGGLYFMRPDLVKAEYWLERAANQGHNEAEESLEAIKLILNKTPPSPTPMNSKDIGVWKWDKNINANINSYSPDYPSARDLYERGMSFFQNREVEKGTDLFEQAINIYNPDADVYAQKSLCALAMLHDTGIHPRANIIEAVKMYKYLVAKPDCLIEKLKLGLLYLEGQKIKHQPEEGLILVKEVFHELEADSLISYNDYQRLAEIFHSGKHTFDRLWNEESVKFAIMLFEKAVRGSRDAGDQMALESARNGLERARERLDTINNW